MPSFSVAPRTTRISHAVRAFTPLLTLTRSARTASFVAITKSTTPRPSGVAASRSFTTAASRPAPSALAALTKIASGAARTVVASESVLASLTIATTPFALTTARFTARTIKAPTFAPTAARVSEAARSPGWPPRIAVATIARSRCWSIVDTYGERPPLDRRPIHLLDDGRDVSCVHFGNRVAVTDLDLTDVIAWNPRLARNRAYEIARTHAVALADAQEQPNEPVLAARGWPIGDARFRAFGRPLEWTFCFHTTSALLAAATLDQPNRRGGDLESVEFSKQWLQRDDFSRGESGLKLRPDRCAQTLVARARFRGDLGNIEWLDLPGR
jgi:hypothetical protein